MSVREFVLSALMQGHIDNSAPVPARQIYSIFILIEGDVVAVWLQNFHFTLSLNLFYPAASAAEPMDDPRGLKNVLYNKNNSFIPRLHQIKCRYDMIYDNWHSQSI